MESLASSSSKAEKRISDYRYITACYKFLSTTCLPFMLGSLHTSSLFSPYWCYVISDLLALFFIWIPLVLRVGLYWCAVIILESVFLFSCMIVLVIILSLLLKVSVCFVLYRLQKEDALQFRVGKVNEVSEIEKVWNWRKWVV